MKKYTRATITNEMFENWKNDCRKEFLDEPESMNLINLCLQNLDEGKSVDKMNIRLMEFYENDLTHAGELFCEHCGNKMEVYYTSQCFTCKKPTERNYFMWKNWLEKNEPDFDADTFWTAMCELGIVEGNDKWIELYEIEDGEDDDYTEQLTILKKHFDINGPIFVSW